MDLEPIGIRLFDTRGTVGVWTGGARCCLGKAGVTKGVSLTDERTIVRKVGRIVVVGNGTAI